MRKRIFQAGAALILTLGGLTVVMFAGRQAPPDRAPTVAATSPAEIKLSERALELHAEIAEEVATRAADEARSEPETDVSHRPDWLQSVVDRGYVDERYADLMLRDDYEEVLQERFHVLKQQPGVREEEGCELAPAPEGEALCWNEWGYHPYLTLELAALRSMASSDALASEALSIRSSDGEASLYYAVQASRLSGKPGPIVRYLSRHSRSPDLDTDNTEQLRRYMLALVVDEMGYPYRHSAEIAWRLELEGVTQETINDALIAGLTIAEPGRAGP